VSNPSIYTVGGTVQANQNGVYIFRKADEELLALCRENKFAYILTSRQMGKSSLMVRTAEQLAEEGIQTVVIDLTQVGVQVTAEQWYLGLLTIIEGILMLDTDVVQWWQENSHLGFTQRLTLFFQDILLKEVASPVVIFVDEIDTTLSLDFTDDFFAAIRYLYVARASDSEFHRLSFVLIGVATPGDLIRDPKRTPFNIGQRVDLTDFTFDEAKPLGEGLGLATNEVQQVLRWMLEWTGGHPYLSQRLCCIISQQDKKSWSKTDVDSLVSSTFLGAMSEQDNNLQFVRDMLTKRAPNKEGVLSVYREIRRGKRPVLDEEQSIVKSHLKLSGVVRRENARLCVRNLIYKKVFDDGWLKQHLPVPFKRLTSQAVLLTSLVVTSLTMSIRYLGVLQPLELQAYDHLMRLRPDEGADERLLVITVTEADIPAQKQRQKSLLSDSTLQELLQKLSPYKPRAIGLDIYRDFPVDSQYPDLATRLRTNNNFIAICQAGGSTQQAVGISPPPEIPPNRIGFSDVVFDRDLVIRRHLLSITPELESNCKSRYSLNFELARQYLAKENIGFDITDEGYLQLGKIVFKPIDVPTGGYQQFNAGGHQILLNYRSSREVAKQVSVAQVLNGQFESSWVKDKIVLIGVDSQSAKDYFFTPYSAATTPHQEIPGVLLHAHMVSQILSAVLDGRPLLWVWPVWSEFIWIWGWSVAGGFLAWRYRNLRVLVLANGSTLLVLYALSFAFMTQSGWVPLVPSALTLLVTSSSVVASHIAVQKQQRLKISKSLLDRLEQTCSLKGENMTNVIARLITEYIIEQNKLPNSDTDEQAKKSKN
jgi:CHASE2 domain-containing sensor protein